MDLKKEHFWQLVNAHYYFYKLKLMEMTSEQPSHLPGSWLTTEGTIMTFGNKVTIFPQIDKHFNPVEKKDSFCVVLMSALEQITLYFNTCWMIKYIQIKNRIYSV